MESKDIFYPLFGDGGCRCRHTPMGGARNEGSNDTSCPETPPCVSGNDPLAGASLAMVYSPEQAFEKLYEPDEALARGTIFIALDKPFFGDGRKC